MNIIQQPSVKEIVSKVWDGKINLRVKCSGQGDPVIFLHNASGLRWDSFIEQLARNFTVYAIEHPGTSEGDPDAIDEVRDLWELVLIYEETIRSLQLKTAPICVGTSVGGMLAAELAACFPSLFSKLALVAPAGLWREDPSPREWLTSDPASMPQRLFRNLSTATVAEYLAPPEDPEVAFKQRANAMWSMGCTGKFLWPLPDRGLRRRLHRITAPTLVLWGAEDDITPTAYAHDFGGAIKGSTVKIVPESGHVVQIEQREAVVAHIIEFIGHPQS